LTEDNRARALAFAKWVKSSGKWNQTIEIAAKARELESDEFDYACCLLADAEQLNPKRGRPRGSKTRRRAAVPA
jgi:hypothetical protein